MTKTDPAPETECPVCDTPTPEWDFVPVEAVDPDADTTTEICGHCFLSRTYLLGSEREDTGSKPPAELLAERQGE